MAGGLLVFMEAIREQESGGNYAAVNPNSGAAGAYQFTFGTWQYALRLAGLSGTRWYQMSANEAPANIQDAAASSLMSTYYFDFGRSWYNVAEAWYGGPGAVGHPNWGGGPGYPTVGEYAAQVMAKYQALGGTGGGPGAAIGAAVGSLFAEGFTNLGRFYVDNITPALDRWQANLAPMPRWYYQVPGKVK